MKKILIILLFIVPTVLFALDPENVPIYQELVKQYQQGAKELKTVEDQLNSLKELNSDIKLTQSYLQGHYGMGQLANLNVAERQWSPDNWNNALSNTIANASPDYKNAVNAFNSTHTLLSKKDFNGVHGSDAEYQDYQNNYNTTRAVSSISQTEYDELNKHLQMINTLQAEIEKSPNEKAAQDLTNRLLVEQIYIQDEQTKMLAIQTQQMAEEKAEKIDEENEGINFAK